MPITDDPRWSCFRKKAYLTAAVARAAAQSARDRSGNDAIYPYQCEHCSLFHIGRARQYQQAE